MPVPATFTVSPAKAATLAVPLMVAASLALYTLFWIVTTANDKAGRRDVRGSGPRAAR